jgi:UDP:flavonoid glycosyltransferase YjiC (YdhE family)
MDESIDRLVRLTEAWPRVCIGSTAEYAGILSDPWVRRMDAAWDAIAQKHARTPAVHMLRGMQLSGREWPFASVDSTDIAQNHNRPQNAARAMADRWDAAQTAARWLGRPKQPDMFEAEAA